MHSISLEKEPNAVVVVASGELDAFVEDDLLGILRETGREARIVIDLAGVSFLDSTALGILVRTVREANARGADVRIVLPTGTARRIFEITTLDRVLPVADSRAQALVELDAPEPA